MQRKAWKYDEIMKKQSKQTGIYIYIYIYQCRKGMCGKVKKKQKNELFVKKEKKMKTRNTSRQVK